VAHFLNRQYESNLTPEDMERFFNDPQQSAESFVEKLEKKPIQVHHNPDVFFLQ
jgi:hypothetical protein